MHDGLRDGLYIGMALYQPNYSVRKMLWRSVFACKEYWKLRSEQQDPEFHRRMFYFKKEMKGETTIFYLEKLKETSAVLCRLWPVRHQPGISMFGMPE